ncbi:MAG TPA: DUF11 domain-containing protein [Conexibacter sp.]
MLALVAVACAAFVTFTAAASADTTGVSSFSKRGVDQQNGSTAVSGAAAGTTGAGHTINWVLNYRNTTGVTAGVNVGDPIVGNQSFVGGSLRTPPALDPRWSTDGGNSYAGSEPGSGVNAVGAAGTSVDGSTGVEGPFSPPVTAFRTSTANGDGWEAIFIGSNVYNVFHHRAGTLAALDCHDKSTGVECAGFPVQYVSPTAGVPFTDNTDVFGTGDNVLMTSSYNNAAYDPATGRIWFATGVVNSTSIGVACADVVTMQSCGYTQLGTAASPNTTTLGGGPNNGAPGIVGGKQLGSKYYSVATGVAGAPVFCFDTAATSPCAGWPASGVLSDPTFAPSPAPPAGADASWLAASLESWGGYLVTSVLRPTGPGTFAHDLGCIVAATGTPCAGFPALGYMSIPPADIANYATAPILDASGNVTGLCGQTSTTTAPGSYACFDLNGRSVGGPPWGQMVPNATVGIDGFSAPLQIGSRLYFAYSSLPRVPGIATYACWDFSTNSRCDGFVQGSSGADVRPYTLRQDPDNPDCIWELGDAGVFEVFSATFGGNPPTCNTGTAEVRLAPEQFYCDGGSSHVTGWNQVGIGGISAADYDAVAITIRDADGNIVPGWSNRVFSSSSAPIDISSIPYAGSTRSLTVSMVISWGAHPVRLAIARAVTKFSGDAPQVCYQTKVGAQQCAAAQPINDDATAITSVAGGPSDAPGGNRSGTASFSLPADPSLCVADVKIRKSASPTPVIAGRTLTYTLQVTNDGPDAAANVVIRDPLPRGVSFLSASAGCSENGGVVDCEVGTLAKGATRTLEVKTRVGSSLAHCPMNVATVSSKTIDPDLDNNTDSVCPPLRGEADLSITKTPAATQVSAGGQIMYVLVVRNNGPSDATGVKVEDPMAAGLTLVSAQPGQGRCSVADGRVSCDLGSLAVGGSTQILVTATTLTSAACPVNVATVHGDQQDPDSRNNSDSARVCTTVTVPPANQPSFDLDVVKTANHRTVYLGQSVSYRIVVLNRGPDAAPDTRLTDTFGAKGTVVSVKTTVGRCTARLPITCSLGTIRSGARVTITVVLRPTTAGSAKRNVASATGRGRDTNPRNNIDGALVAVKKIPLRLTKTVNRTVARAGGTFNYTIRVTNPSMGVAHHVQVCDTLPSGLVYVSSSQKVKLAHGRYCWPAIATLGAHRSHSYRMTVRALGGAAGRKTNVATATSPDIARTLTARRTVRIIAGAILGGGVTG